MITPMVDYKIHWLKMMSVPESRAVVGRHDGINGRDTRVGGVDQRCRAIWKCTHQLHDAVVRAIPAAMTGVNHGKVLPRRCRVSRPRPIEHDRPYTPTAACQQGDLGGDPSRGAAAVALPTIRTRPHHIIAIHEHPVLHRLVHVVLPLPSCWLISANTAHRRPATGTQRMPSPCARLR